MSYRLSGSSHDKAFNNIDLFSSKLEHNRA